MVGRDEAGALGDGDEGAEVVEEVDEKEDEDDLEGTEVAQAGEVEPEGGFAEGGEAVPRGLPVDMVKEDAG